MKAHSMTFWHPRSWCGQSCKYSYRQCKQFQESLWVIYELQGQWRWWWQRGSGDICGCERHYKQDGGRWWWRQHRTVAVTCTLCTACHSMSLIATTVTEPSKVGNQLYSRMYHMTTGKCQALWHLVNRSPTHQMLCQKFVKASLFRLLVPQGGIPCTIVGCYRIIK